MKKSFTQKAIVKIGKNEITIINYSSSTLIVVLSIVAIVVITPMVLLFLRAF